MDRRKILHCDQNCFFAAVEQAANPALRGKPIAVVGSGGRTVITTSSYEARAFGVKTGMAIWEGKRHCPELIIVVGDNRKYTSTSKQIMEIFLDYTPIVEPYSIDEAFLDITGSLKLFESPDRIAHLIKARIKHKFNITCSIGVAPNKLLAKLASDLKKPDGYVHVEPEDVNRLLDRLPVKELCGVGKKTAATLKLMNINTCGELGRCDVQRLIRRFGDVVGRRLREMGQGIDDSPVIPFGEEQDCKSVGHSMTLARDISDPTEIRRFLLQLSEMVGSRARQYNMTGKTISLYVRYADFFSSWGKQTSLKRFVNLTDEIYKAALSILEGVELTQPVRLLGISLSNLKHEGEQLSLFVEDQKKIDAIRAMDQVNQRFGRMAVTFGSLLPGKENAGNHVIPPSWRPGGVKDIEME